MRKIASLIVLVLIIITLGQAFKHIKHIIKKRAKS